MLIHNCIKCDDLQLIPMPQKTPVMKKYKCPECNTVQWIKMSRIDPYTYSEDSIIVDEKTKSVTIKGA